MAIETRVKKTFQTKRRKYKVLQSGNIVIAWWQGTKIFTAISTSSELSQIVKVKRK